MQPSAISRRFWQRKALSINEIFVAESIDKRNYYEVLHVDRDAPLEVIRCSYRRLMQQLKNHPDLGGDTATAALINKAYAVLSNPQTRTEYDARLDILRRVARGFVDESIVEADPVEPQRMLDPARECVFCALPHDRGSAADAKCENCGSPLSPAEHIRVEPEGQRAVKRIRRRLDITFFTDWRQSKGFRGRIEDISPNGLRLVTKRDVRKGQRIRLVSDVIEAVGSVTHCAPRSRGWHTENVAGVSFVTLRFVRPVGAFVSRRV